MLLGICPKCHSYDVLNVEKLSCGKTASLCDDCLLEQQITISKFANSLIVSASNLADKGDKYALTRLKEEARKCYQVNFINKIELLQVERIFVSLQPT